jgi:hypothetical protein
MRARGLVFVAVAAFDLASQRAQAADLTPSECIEAADHGIALQGAGRLGKARSSLALCSSSACPLEIRSDCVERVEQINVAMPTVVFDVKDERGADLDSCEVVVDGRAVFARVSGSALSVDPGPHDFAFRAPRFEEMHEHLVLYEGVKDRHERVVLSRAVHVRPGHSDADPRSRGAPGPAPADGAGAWSGRARAASPSVSLASMIVASAGFAALGVGLTLVALGATEENRAGGEDRIAKGFGQSDHVAAQEDWTAGTIVAGSGFLASATAVILAMRNAGAPPATGVTAYGSFGSERPGALHLLPTIDCRGADLWLTGSF